MKKFAMMILGASIFFTGLGAVVKQAGELIINNFLLGVETSKTVEVPKIVKFELSNDSNEKPTIH